MFKPTLAILAGVFICYQPMAFADSEMFRDINDDELSGYSAYGYEYRDHFPREIDSVRHIRNCGTCGGYYGEYNMQEGIEPGTDYLNDHR